MSQWMWPQQLQKRPLRISLTIADAVKEFDFLIDGRARAKIEEFIRTQPKFEDICLELQKYNKFVEQTQEISSLEYFTFIR